MNAIVYPQIDPVAFSIGPLEVHWYGIMYLIGFVLAWLLALWRAKRYQLDWNSEAISDLIFYAALGVILGGRLGYMLFYNFSSLIAQPWSLFMIWEGGMSFHGGLIGVLIALLVLSYKISKPYLVITDFLAPLVPLGLAAGRLGNFINGELWGKPTDVPWAMQFLHVDDLPRHPSQLYECGLEGVGLFVLVWWYAAKPRPVGAVSGVFLIGYAFARIIVEFFRQPDVQLGYLGFGWLTMGQVLSLPMLFLGIFLLWVSRNEKLSKSA